MFTIIFSNSCNIQVDYDIKAVLQDRLQILSELINYYFVWNQEKTCDYLIISSGTEAN